MNKPLLLKITWSIGMIVGIVAMQSGSTSLQSNGAFRHDRNSFAVQGSAYGRLLARLSETTIDRVWHLGIEQIVPHNIDGSLASGATAPAVTNQSANSLPSAGESLPRKPALTLAKNWFGNMRIAKYTRTNSNPLNERHLAAVYKDVEEMLLRSYKMDPGHYGAYNSYHLFLTTHSFGGTPESKEHARKIANMTIGYVARETEDPEPWLTAASAAVNLYILETEELSISGTLVPLEILEEYRERIGFCLQKYEELADRAKESGMWKNLSTERQYEIVQRGRFSVRTFAQFDPMIERAKKRLESEAGSLPESEVAASTDTDEG